MIIFALSESGYSSICLSIWSQKTDNCAGTFHKKRWISAFVHVSFQIIHICAESGTNIFIKRFTNIGIRDYLCICNVQKAESGWVDSYFFIVRQNQFF